jgi:carboxyl-terminal processing protease
MLKTSGRAAAVTALLLWAGNSAAHGQNRRMAEQALNRVHDEIRRNYYDSTYQRVNLEARKQQALAQIRAATYDSHAMVAIARYVGSLKDSHTFFIPPRYADTYKLGFELRFYGEDCFVFDVDSAGPARALLKRGDRVLAIDDEPLQRSTFSDLMYQYYVLQPRPRITLNVQRGDANVRPVLIEADIARGPKRLDPNSPLAVVRTARAIQELEKDLAHRYAAVDSVLIWHMPSFEYRDANISRLLETARKSPVLILDLRGNTGGDGETMLRLVGGVFDRKVVAGYVLSRREQKRLEASPAREPFQGRLIVLVDSESASASEVFARVVQNEKRGIVVGDRTAGAVRASRWASYQNNAGWEYGLSITVSDFMTSDGERLEGTGVRPDLFVLQSSDDLLNGGDRPLAFALELAGIRMTSLEAGKLLKK